MKKSLLAAIAAAAVMAAGSAFAAPLSVFGMSVDIYQSVDDTGNLTDTADATLANALAAPFIGSTTYTGEINFMTSNGNDSTTIKEWLESAGGSYDALGGGADDLEISNPNIGNDTATTTWFVFSGITGSIINDLQVQHDDGLTILVDGSPVYTSVQPQTAGSFSSPFDVGPGTIQFVYAATNGDPSVLKTKAGPNGGIGPVPLPAAAWMLLAGVGGLVTLKRRKKA